MHQTLTIESRQFAGLNYGKKVKPACFPGKNQMNSGEM